jgi:citronellyl-CoA synthetase
MMGAINNFIGDLRVLYAAATRKPVPGDTRGSFAHLLEANAERLPNAIAVIHEDESVTWRELNQRANRIAAVLAADGVGRGDCVSLLMQNRVEFLVNLMAILKLGAVAGLINTNLTKASLVHCINLTESRKCIFGEELTEPLNEVRAELSLADGTDYLCVRDAATAGEPPPNWAKVLDSTASTADSGNPASSRESKLGDRALYIFTSGTTGLPKAAVVSHKRIIPNAAMGANLLLRINSSDRMYNCLPLYHGTSLIIGVASAFTAGATTVLRRRLSVSAFWEDIRKHQCTSFVYIGEFIRYLLARPAGTDDQRNPVRTIIGNGLRPDIWIPFKQRFNIERVGEFYAASEGNGGFANVFNKDCTVGLSVSPCKLVAYDVSSDEIIRDDAGFCREVPDGDPGLLLIGITSTSQFEGYTNADATAKKVLNNVLEKGDSYFNSGDLMKVVDVGFAYRQKHYQFVDRVGDTFRWKSENVSTNEVAELINTFNDIIFTNIYGVEIPGTDGRAGMAAIVLGEQVPALDVIEIAKHVTMHLPSYARPIFIRLLGELPTTSTHKMQKNELRDQAFHLDQVEDPLYVLRPGDTAYSKLDSDFYQRIMAREISF